MKVNYCATISAPLPGDKFPRWIVSVRRDGQFVCGGEFSSKAEADAYADAWTTTTEIVLRTEARADLE